MTGLSEDSETKPIELVLQNSSFDIDEPDQTVDELGPTVDEALPELDTPQFKVVRLLKRGGMGLVYTSLG